MAKIFTKIFLWFISLIFILSLYSGSILAENSSIIRPESSFVPDANFFDIDGNKVFLDQFEGKTILVSFWATWCGSCVEELPSLDILQKDFRKLPFEVLAISEDFKGIAVAEEHFNKYGIRHLKLYHDYKNSLFKAFSVIGLPTAFLIDPEGKIKIIFKGNTKWHDESIRDILLSEIPGNPETPKNSYNTTSLNKKIAPPGDKSGEKNLKQHSQEVKAKAEPDNQNQKLQNDAQKDKLEKKDEINKQK